MRRLIAVTLALLACGDAHGQFVVQNRVPPAFAVENRVPVRGQRVQVCDGKTCRWVDQSVTAGSPAAAPCAGPACANGACAGACDGCATGTCYAVGQEPAWWPGKALGRPCPERRKK